MRWKAVFVERPQPPIPFTVGAVLSTHPFAILLHTRHLSPGTSVLAFLNIMTTPRFKWKQ
jgi:hypothetical protein